MITWAEIRKHYEHARKKHPQFAENFFEEYDTFYDYFCKEIVESGEVKDPTTACGILEEELMEMYDEVKKGDKKRAREEILDCIAVLMRMADMVEQDELEKKK